MDRQDVHLFVFDTLSNWEAGYAVAGINQPQFQRHPGRYGVREAALFMKMRRLSRTAI